MNAESIKARLRNLAKETGKTMQDILVLYGLERTIYRLSISQYAERFTLKGGIFLYALFNGDYARATTDIDLLAQYIPNDTNEMKKIFNRIFAVECDDALKFNLDTLEVINITEFKEYHGVKVSIMAYLDKTKIPVSVDIGFGDVIYPERVDMVFPTLLGMEAPKIFAYSVVTAIAEKFEAFVSLGLVNSRYKDFYDIYIIALKYDINGNSLQHAVKQTFDRRATDFEDIVAFDEEFIIDPLRQSRWNAFIKKKKAMMKIGLKDTMLVIMELLIPIVNAIRNIEEFHGEWMKDEMKWHCGQDGQTTFTN